RVARPLHAGSGRPDRRVRERALRVGGRTDSRGRRNCFEPLPPEPDQANATGADRSGPSVLGNPHARTGQLIPGLRDKGQNPFSRADPVFAFLFSGGTMSTLI